MTTLIDELVITLGLDPSKFTEGQKKAVAAIKQLEQQAVKSGKETESQSKKLIDFFVNLKREALGFVAAFYGGRGIKDIVQQLTHLDAGASRLAETLGIQPEVLAKWRIAMKEVGGTTEELDSVLDTLKKTYHDFLQNPADVPVPLLTMMQRLGLDPKDLDDPIKVMEALAKFAHTQPDKATFAAQARFIPGMNDSMVNLLWELDKRLKAAEAVTPADGGLGAFSKEFIASMALFSTAAENVARVLLNWFVPAINSFTKLLTSWLPQTGSSDDKAQEKKLREDLKKKSIQGTADAFANWVDSWIDVWGTGKATTPPKPSATKSGGKDTGIGVFSGATGYSIEEGGVITGQGTFPVMGARGAAAVNNSTTSSNRTSNNTVTNEVNIGAVNINAPNATDASGIAGSIKPALGSSLAAPINSGLQ